MAVDFVTPHFMDSTVSPADIAAHLRLYGSIRSHLFVLAQKHVYYDDQDILWPTTPGRLYLRRSIYRFRLWIHKILRPRFEQVGSNHEGLRDIEIPPYDVLLVLHSFMLHPRAFYSDTIRLFPELGILNGFPLAQAAALIDDSMNYAPSSGQVALWEAATGEPFSIPLATSPEEEFFITCPSCHTTFKDKWLQASEDGNGSALVTRCSDCRLVITDLVLGAAIFSEDVLRAKSGSGVGLAGTILTKEGILNPEYSRVLTMEIARAVDLEDVEKYSVDKVAEKLMEVPEAILQNISVDFLNLYGLPGGFSLDLGAAVLRQTAFASKMYHNGWTNPQFPKNCQAILEESISRYAGFLQLTMDRSVGSLGPAHDIDLVWHTHQLKVNYRTDFLRIFGWFLDHVDFAPIDVLATSYSNGGDKWQDTFGTPYHEYFLNAKYPLVEVY